MKKKTFITGIAGQTGSYLAELLLSKGYAVHGLVRRRGPDAVFPNIQPLIEEGKVALTYGDVDSAEDVDAAVKELQPDEVYHLAARHLGVHNAAKGEVLSPEEDERRTFRTNALGSLHVLQSVAKHKKDARVFLAGSREIFGNAVETPQRETTQFSPNSAYGVAKVAAFHFGCIYRAKHNLFAVTGTLFNHESPRREAQFVTRKITQAVAKIKLGLADSLELGNLDAIRDWTHAKDIARAAWAMLQAEHPSDYVLGSGVARTVGDFAKAAFDVVDLDPGKFILVNPAFVRPKESHPAVADPKKANTELGWKPEISFEALIEEMVSSDLILLKK